MFNLKRKVKQISQSVKQSFEPIRDPQVVIAEIHEAFDTASEKLLNDAKKILSGQYDFDKGDRLRLLGFTKAKKAVEAAKIIYEKQQSDRIAALIEYYRIHFPNNKFITEEMVKEICQKYGLLLARIENFIGDVPEKNITEIESFKKHQNGLQEYRPAWYRYVDGKHIECNETEKGAAYGYLYWDKHLIFAPIPQDQSFFYEAMGLKICASVKDFDTENMNIQEGYKLEVNLPDPIVLQPVTGGHLIVTKWGLEGKDELLINEIQN